jgi:hypothetical protein
MPVDLSDSVGKGTWSAGDDPTDLPQAVRTIMQSRGEQIRAAINAGRPDGRRQIALVLEREVNGRPAYEVGIDETAKIAAGWATPSRIWRTTSRNAWTLGSSWSCSCCGTTRCTPCH